MYVYCAAMCIVQPFEHLFPTIRTCKFLEAESSLDKSNMTTLLGMKDAELVNFYH